MGDDQLWAEVWSWSFIVIFVAIGLLRIFDRDKICPVCNTKCGHYPHRAGCIYCGVMGQCYSPVVGIGGFVWCWVNETDERVGC